MEPRRPVRCEPDRHSHRVVTERGFLVEVALPQSDNSAPAEIDRRQQVEGACHPSFYHVSVLAG